MVTWALYRRAHHTVLVYGEEELRLETGGRPVWEVRWDQIAGWHRENGLHGLVKCIVLDCVDGSTRRVKVGWLRKQVWFFADMLAELAQRTGAQDATPLEEDDPDRGLTRDQEALLSLAVAVAFALVLGILALLSRLAS